MANSVDPDQTAPIGAVCSESTLFASILNSSVMLDNYLQQTTSADEIFRRIFSWKPFKCCCTVIYQCRYRGSYTSAHFLMNLGNKLRGLLSICPFFEMI